MKQSRELPAIGVATVGTGAALTAAVASACCVGPALAPVFLSVFGASGLVAVSYLRPYTLWLLLGSGAMLLFSFVQLYRKNACAVDAAPSRLSYGVRIARVVVWVAALFWLASTAYAAYGLLHE